VLEIEIHPPAIIDGVTQDLAGVHLEAIESIRWRQFEPADRNRLTPYLAFEHLANSLGIHRVIRCLVFFSLW
jgi:hypothetical protein